MKSIHWNIPFTSVKGDSYLLWIYDEGFSGNQVRLQAGQVPFTTEENTDTDFFSPVRGSTGSISIIDPDGTVMNSLLPDNNTSRPVRLIKSVDGGQQIVWQGFLTCNTYSQGYTNRPQEVSLQVASLLDAADSISAKQSDFSGLMTVRQIIHMCVAAIKDEFGRPAAEELISTFYFPKADWRILNHWVNTSIFFEEKEVSNENRTTYIVVGKSIKHILETICKFMGWCVRECPNKVLSFQRMNDKNSTYLYVSYADFANGDKSLGSVWHEEVKSSVSLADLSYRGADHEISTTQGGKSVEVVANVAKQQFSYSIPEIPSHSLIDNPSGITLEKFEYRNGLYHYIGDITITAKINTDAIFDSRCNFLYKHVNSSGAIDGDATLNQVLSSAMIYGRGGQLTAVNPYIGSFLGKIKAGSDEMKDGLYVVGYNIVETPAYSPTSTNHIFQLASQKYYYLPSGTLKLKCGIIPITNGDDWIWADGIMDNVFSIMVSIEIGGKYWNGSSWSSSFSYISKTIEELKDCSIPINSALSGIVNIRIYPYVNGNPIVLDQNQCFGRDMFITELTLDLQDSDFKNNRSSNHYYQLLGTKFDVENSVSTDLSSDMSNHPSPHIIMYSQYAPMSYITYSYPSGDEIVRPEKDLLARLARFYKRRRRTIKLEVEHINDSLPTTRVTADGIPCEPIAESRDYQLDKTTVTLMEESANSEK